MHRPTTRVPRSAWSTRTPGYLPSKLLDCSTETYEMRRKLPPSSAHTYRRNCEVTNTRHICSLDDSRCYGVVNISRALYNVLTLHYAQLFYIMLPFSVLYKAIPYHTLLYCTILYFTVLFSIFCTIQHYYYTMLHFYVLHHIILYNYCAIINYTIHSTIQAYIIQSKTVIYCYSFSLTARSMHMWTDSQSYRGT
jgi:hypothetical protein